MVPRVQSESVKSSALLLAAGIFLLLSVGGVAVYTATRGLRNNNPGNIRYDGTAWDGMDSPPQDDLGFVRFVTPEYGIRALAKVLQSYKNKYGLNTVQGIISRWAPPSENNTTAYISDVAGELGVTPNQPLDDTHLPGLISAIIKHENGLDPYAANTIDAGIALV